jgi:hypothetical protein
VNVSLAGDPVQVKADPLHLPFAENPSMPACWPYVTVVQRSASSAAEADRVLIDDGWMILSGFNPVSLMGLQSWCRCYAVRRYNSRMFTLMRQLDWLSLNFEVLHYGRFQVFPGPAGETAEHPSAGAGLHAADCCA